MEAKTLGTNRAEVGVIVKGEVLVDHGHRMVNAAVRKGEDIHAVGLHDFAEDLAIMTGSASTGVRASLEGLGLTSLDPCLEPATSLKQ